VTTTTTEVKGLAELEKFLDALPEKVQVKIARNAMSAGARVIRDEAKRLAPVKTGALRSSVRVSTRQQINGQITATIRAGGKTKTGDAFYAHFVEYGTEPHAIKPRPKGLFKVLKIGGVFVRSVNHPGAKARPFMRPAFDASALKSVDAFAAQLSKRISNLK
jgi:HK97 gp10 family phage protein